MTVDLFIPCFVDQLYPETGFNFVKILKKAGIEVNYIKEQTCCGQPSFNGGHWNESKKLAIKFLKHFSGSNPIVSPSGSCTAYVKRQYSRLLEGTRHEEMVKRVSENIYELTDFLVNRLNISDLGSQFNAKVTYHDSCSALREYGIKQEPRTLLSNVRGLELIEMDEPETCCGFGGTFSAKYPEIAAAMAEQKAQDAVNSGAQYIVATESSCLMNINGYIAKHKLPIKTIHIADILASGI